MGLQVLCCNIAGYFFIIFFIYVGSQYVLKLSINTPISNFRQLTQRKYFFYPVLFCIYDKPIFPLEFDLKANIYLA